MSINYQTCCSCFSLTSGSACCDNTCVCGPIGTPDCSCECPSLIFQNPIRRPLFQNSFINLKARNASLYILANYFNHLFPGQIGIPVHSIYSAITINLENIPVANAIDYLGLVRLTPQLTSYIYF